MKKFQIAIPFLTIIFFLLGLCVFLFQTNQISQRALECSTYVHTGTDLTGKGKNNCTNPELIP